MIFCDCAAAMPPDPEVLEFFCSAAGAMPVNQEAIHSEAYRLRRKLEEADRELSLALTGESGWQIIHGDSGTGLIELFCSIAVDGKAAVSSRLEHPALESGLRRYAKKLQFMTNDRHGVLLSGSFPQVQAAAIHLVQSELGTIQPVNELFDGLPENCIKFVDAIQGAGKIPLPAETADVIAISGVKFGAPGGAALLLSPRWHGREGFVKKIRELRKQHKIARPNPWLAQTLAFAASKRAANMQKDLRQMTALNLALREKLAAAGGAVITLGPQNVSPYILHLLLPGKQGAVAVRLLSEAGIAAASGSACAAETGQPSTALAALGISRDGRFSGLRLSFGFGNEYLSDKALESLPETLAKAIKNMLQKY